MKKIALLFLFFVFFSPIVSLAQIGTLYGDDHYQSGYRIKATNDGGFIVGGSSDAYLQDTLAYYIIRFDRLGKPMWDSLYGRYPYEDFLWSVRPTSDNGALLAGYSGKQYSRTEEALLYKIDSVGRVVKKIEVNYGEADHAHWFAETPDGNYYWAGHTDSKGDLPGDMIAQKLDKNFNLIWEKTYGGKDTAEHCHAAAITPDGGCILLGHTTVGGREKYYAVRIDSSGKPYWQKTYGTTPANHDSPYDVVVTKEGNYAFFGGSSAADNSAESAWLLVVDSNGTILIDKHFGTGFTFGWSGIQTSDGGYAVIGTRATTQNTNLYVVKTDGTGALQWEKTYGTDAGEAGYGIIQRGSQYIATGEAPDGTGNLDLWVVVLDSVGNLTTLDTATADAPAKPIASVRSLGESYPNPASDHSTIQVYLPEREHITLELLTVSGQVLKTVYSATAEAGYHYIQMNLTDVASGNYYYRLSTPNEVLTRNCIVVK